MNTWPTMKALTAALALVAVIVLGTGCPGDSPGVSLCSADPDPANASPIRVEVTFTAWVSGFAASDVATSNASASNLTGYGTSYAFDLVPTREGVVSAQIPANVAKDWGGSYNTESEPLSRVYDGTPPSVSVTATTGGQKNVSPIPVEVVFSEPVTGFTASDIVVTNATVSGFGGSGTTYSFNLIPLGDGELTASIPSGVAYDAAGNGNTAGPLLSLYYDANPPTVAVDSASADPTNALHIPVEVAFSEAVTGFEVSDLIVANASVGGFSGSGASYYFELTPLGDGVVTVDIPADVAVDAGGSGNFPADPFSRLCDFTPPVPALDSGAADPTNESPILVTVSFSEPVLGFEAADVVTANGAVAGFSGSGADYSFELVPAGNGEVTALVGADAAYDAAGNGSDAAPPFSRVYSGSAPSVSMDAPVGSPTNASPIAVAVVFSEPVTGFEVGDVVLSNAAIDGFSGSGAEYGFNLVPGADGPVSAGIPEGVAVNAVGTGNTAASALSLVYDGTGPSVSLSSPTDDPTNVSPIPVTVTFSEAVLGFSAEDVVATNAAVSGFAGSGAEYSFALVPATDGPVTAGIAAGVAEDEVGNANTAATALSRQYKGSAPSVTLGCGEDDPTNTSSIPVTVIFSEPVTGFEAGDVVLSNAAIDGFAGAGAEYGFNLVPDADGPISASIPEGAAVNDVGTGNTAAGPVSLVYDGTGPSVSLSSPTDGPSNVSPIPVTVTFSEAVLGFSAEDVAATNAAVNDFTGSGSEYSFDLVPAADGPVTAGIAAGVAEDEAGNGNTAASALSLVYDGTGPSVILSSAADDPTNVSPIPVTVTFSEAVLGFSAEDVATTNAAVSDFTGSGAEYSFDLVPGADGLVTADLAAGVAEDEAGNGSTAAGQLSRQYKGTAPSLTLGSTVANPTNVSPIPVTATFGEPVVGFEAADVVTQNASVASFTGSGAEYSFDLVPASDGLITAEVAAGAAQNELGSGSAAAQFTAHYDGTGPTLCLTSPAGDLTNASPIPVTAAFSEPVVGFEAADIVTENGSVANFAGAGAEYTFDLVPAANGTVTVDVAEGAAQDAAGNGSGATQLSMHYDGSEPTVSLSSSEPNPTGANPIPVTAVFSEPVVGFEAADVTAGNASVANFTGSGAEYSFDLVPVVDGTVTANINAGAVKDTAGNDSPASAPFSRLYDGTAPTVVMFSDAPDPVTESPISVTVQFSESVVFLDPDDIIVSNATVENFGGSGANYGFDLVPLAAGLVTADIPAGVAWDVVGHEIAAAPQFSRQYDPAPASPPPTVTMSTTAPNPTAEFPIPVSVEFSEAVTGFQAADVVVANGVVGAFGGSGASYSFELVPNDEGEVAADIAADAATSVGGQGNEAAEQFCITYLTEPCTPPEAVIEVNEADWATSRRAQGYYAGVTKTCSYAPFAVFFEGWKSTPREEIVDYEWDFGDGSEAFHGFNAAHVYQEPGSYVASLTVTSEFGWTSTDTLTIEVLESDGVTYYVDAESGDDGNEGTSPGSAWRTALYAFDQSYGPGDRVLFRRGQTFPMAAKAMSYTSWRDRYGFMFGAFGDGPKPLVQLVGSQDGWLFPEVRMAYVAFADLAFNMTSSEGAKATVLSATSVQNVLFMRCDVESCHMAFLFLGDADSGFIVDCTSYDSYSVHLYMKCTRVAIVDSMFDYSLNGHSAYLSTLDKGVVTGCSFSRCPRGQHALRLSGHLGSNNVVISDNTFTGWDDPLYEGSAHSGHGYNWLLVHLASNTADFQTMNDVTFEDNLLEGGRHLLNVGNYENLVVRNNVLNVVDTAEDSIIAIGGLHTWDTVPLRNVTFTENIISAPAMDGSPSYVRPVWSVLPYSGSTYEGRSDYENIRIEKNVILMDGGLSRLLRFEENDSVQIAEVHSDNQVVYCEHEDDELYQVGGTCYAQSGTRYTVETWQQATGNSAGTVAVPYDGDSYTDWFPPVAGWASVRSAVYGGAVTVPYRGAFDVGSAGLKEVRLWVKINEGAWQDTGLVSSSEDGSFLYQDAATGPTATYHFAVQAEDNAGNVSPAPRGLGHCQTLYVN